MSSSSQVRRPTPSTAEAFSVIAPAQGGQTSSLDLASAQNKQRPLQAQKGDGVSPLLPFGNALETFATAVPFSKLPQPNSIVRQSNPSMPMSEVKKTLQREAAAALMLKRDTPGFRCEAKVSAVIHDKALKPTWRTDAEIPTTDVAKHRCQLVSVEPAAFDFIPTGNDEYKILKKLEPMPRPLQKIKELVDENRQLIGVDPVEVEQIRLQIRIKRGEVGEVEAIKGTQTVLAEVSRVLQEAKDRSNNLPPCAGGGNGILETHQSQKIATDVKHELLYRFVKAHPIDCVGVATKAMQDVRGSRVDRIRVRKGQKRHVHVLFKEVFKDLSASAFPSRSLKGATMDLVKGRTGHTGELLEGYREGNESDIYNVLQPLKCNFWNEPADWMVSNGVLDQHIHFGGAASNITTSIQQNPLYQGGHTSSTVNDPSAQFSSLRLDMSQTLAMSAEASQLVTRVTTPATLLYIGSTSTPSPLNTTRVGVGNATTSFEATLSGSATSYPLGYPSYQHGGVHKVQSYSSQYSHQSTRASDHVRLDACGQARFAGIVQRIMAYQNETGGGPIDFTAEKPLRYIQMTAPQQIAPRVSIVSRNSSVGMSRSESPFATGGGIPSEAVSQDPTAEELSLIASITNASAQEGGAGGGAHTLQQQDTTPEPLSRAVSHISATSHSASNAKNGLKSAAELVETVGHWKTLYQYMYADALATAKSDEDEEIKSNPLPDDFEPTCVICWSQYDQCRGVGGRGVGGKEGAGSSSVARGSTVMVDGTPIRLNPIFSNKAISAKQRRDAETADLLRSAEKAESGLTHWKAMHQHVNVRQRKALERAIECRDVSSEFVNRDPHQLARLLQGANQTSIHWRLARSLSPPPVLTAASLASTNSQRREDITTTLKTQQESTHNHTPPRSQSPFSPPKRLSTDEFSLDPKYSALEWLDVRKELAHSVGQLQITQPKLTPRQALTPKDEETEHDRVSLQYARGSDNMSTTSISKRRVGLNSLWDKPRKDMTLQLMRWHEVEKLWIRLAGLMIALHFPENRLEERLLEDLLNILLETKCVRRSTFFVWLRTTLSNTKKRSQSSVALSEGSRLGASSTSLANFLIQKDGDTNDEAGEGMLERDPLPIHDHTANASQAQPSHTPVSKRKSGALSQVQIKATNQSYTTGTSYIGSSHQNDLIHFLTSTRRGYRFLCCMCKLFEIPQKVLELWCKAPNQRREGWKIPMDEYSSTT